MRAVSVNVPSFLTPRVLVAFLSFCGVRGTFGSAAGTGGCGDWDASDDSLDDSDDSAWVNFRFRAMAGGRAGVLDGIWKVASMVLEVAEVGVGIDSLVAVVVFPYWIG